MTPTIRPELTGCPRWCIEGEDAHGDLHESALTWVDLPDRNPLYIALSEDATARSRPTVTVHDGDNLLLDVTAASARSLAAALVAAADAAEGIRR